MVQVWALPSTEEPPSNSGFRSEAVFNVSFGTSQELSWSETCAFCNARQARLPSGGCSGPEGLRVTACGFFFPMHPVLLPNPGLSRPSLEWPLIVPQFLSSGRKLG